MNNYINKLSCLYIEQRNNLSGPLVLVYDQICHISMDHPDLTVSNFMGNSIFVQKG